MNGLPHYIDDANTRFTDLLLTSSNRRISGLARIDIRDGLPLIKDDNNNYVGALFNAKYDLTLFYIESGDRKFVTGGFEASVDLIVSANMNKFTSKEEEDLIDDVYQVFKSTNFKIATINRDLDALEGFNYTGKLSETMHPFFVFRFKTKIIANFKQK